MITFKYCVGGSLLDTSFVQMFILYRLLMCSYLIHCTVAHHKILQILLLLWYRNSLNRSRLCAMPPSCWRLHLRRNNIKKWKTNQILEIRHSDCTYVTAVRIVLKTPGFCTPLSMYVSDFTGVLLSANSQEKLKVRRVAMACLQLRTGD